MSKLRPRCSECGVHLVMHTDAPFGYGRIRWLHEGPCVKLVPRPIIGYCAVEDCERPVYEDDHDGRKKRLSCSDACEKILVEEKRKAGLAACKRYQERLKRSSTTFGGRAA